MGRQDGNGAVNRPQELEQQVRLYHLLWYPEHQQNCKAQVWQGGEMSGRSCGSGNPEGERSENKWDQH